MVLVVIILLVGVFQSIHTADEFKKVADLSFTPVTLEWQARACWKMGTELWKSLEDSWGSKGSKLAIPKVTEEIKADGNCYFRAISYCITGVQDEHMHIRTKLVDYMRSHMREEVDENHLMQMATRGAWATEAEIRATALLLETPVFVYAKNSKDGFEWVQYTSRKDYNLVFDDDIPRIYLVSVNENHFEVVKEVADDESPTYESCVEPPDPVTSEGEVEMVDTESSRYESCTEQPDTDTSDEEVERADISSTRSEGYSEQIDAATSSRKDDEFVKKWTYSQGCASRKLGVKIVRHSLTKPKATAKMLDDGNTFFRAISYWVTGDEDAHLDIRHEVVDYMTDRRRDYKLSRDHLRKMALNGREATKAEIRATAHLLETPIFVYTYSENEWKWVQYKKLEMNDELPIIYLQVNDQRYEVVTDVD